MTFDHEQVQQFAKSLAERGKQPATVESYGRDASRFMNYIDSMKLPLGQVEPENLIAYQKYLRETIHHLDPRGLVPKAQQNASDTYLESPIHHFLGGTLKRSQYFARNECQS